VGDVIKKAQPEPATIPIIRAPSITTRFSLLHVVPVLIVIVIMISSSLSLFEGNFPIVYEPSTINITHVQLFCGWVEHKSIL
jgi:hypothetical protein